MGSLKRKMKAEHVPGRPSTGRGTVVSLGRRPAWYTHIDFTQPMTTEEHARNVAYLNKRLAHYGLPPYVPPMIEVTR